MIYGIYAICDTVAGAYMAPQVAVNDNVATRTFAANFAKEGDVMSLNAADFRLYKLGEYDVSTGVIDAFDAPIVVIDGISARNLVKE